MLKEQIPIGGTNLFINTPYKWHDNTNPGCYATWLKETYEGVELKEVTMVCSKDDQQWYDTTDALWVFEGATIMDGEIDDLYIKNIGAGEEIHNYLPPLFSPSSNSPVQQPLILVDPKVRRKVSFVLRSDSANKNHLQLSMSNKDTYIVQQSTANHRSALFYVKPQQQTQAFYNSFYHAIKLDARMYDFVFTPPMEGVIAQHTSKKDLIDSYDINNDSPATLSRTVKVSEKITNEFAWGLPQSLRAFAHVTGSAGIPFLAEGKAETGFDLTVGANENWKKSEEKLFEMSYLVSVPPNTNVRVSAWYELIKGISMEYTARTEITATTSRITTFDDLVTDARATGEMIRRHLDFLKFDGTIVEIKEHSVITQITGTMVASVGVRGQLNVDGKTVAAAV